MENGTAMLGDMLTAYDAGAKYIVVFNYPTYPNTNPYGILTGDQFAAMKKFWSQINSNQENAFGSANAQICSCSSKRLWLGHENINRFNLGYMEF